MEHANLCDRTCKPCEGGTPPLTADVVASLAAQIPDWTVADDHRSISREWKFKTYADAQAFVNQVGAVAEAEGHHPDVVFGWGYARLTLTTHAVKGLSKNDFILAAKIDRLGS